MFKIFVVVSLALVCHVAANVDATSFGLPADNHKTAFGAALPQSSGLADATGPELELVDVSPQDEQQQSVNHVKELFANAFNSIKVQREAALAASPSTVS